MSQRTLYKQLNDYRWLQRGNEPLNDFTKQISRIEWEVLTKKNKKKYNKFAMDNNIPIYAKAK